MRTSLIALAALALPACVPVSPIGIGPGPGGGGGGSGATGIDPNRPATYGYGSLQAGFQVDPNYVDVQAGGQNPRNCRGATYYFAGAPDYEFDYFAGGYDLAVLADSYAPVAILVNFPDGSYTCSHSNTQFSVGGKPVVASFAPQSGNYDVWVGAQTPNQNPSAQIIISERDLSYFR